MSKHSSNAGSIFNKSTLMSRSPPLPPNNQRKPIEKYTQNPKVICIECGIGDTLLKAICQKCFSAAHLTCSINQDRKVVLVGAWYCNKCTAKSKKKSNQVEIKPSTSAANKQNEVAENVLSTKVDVPVNSNPNTHSLNDTNNATLLANNLSLNLSKLGAQSTQIQNSNQKSTSPKVSGTSKASSNAKSKVSSKGSSKVSSKSSTLSMKQRLEMLAEQEEAEKLALAASQLAEEARQKAEFIKKKHQIISEGNQDDKSQISSSNNSSISEKQQNIKSWIENSHHVQFDPESQTLSQEVNRQRRQSPPTRSYIQNLDARSGQASTSMRHQHAAETLPWLRPNISEREFHDITIAGNQQSSRRIKLSKTQIQARSVISKELPSFSGDPLKWPHFITAYINSTQQCGFTDEENMARLNKSLTGEAFESVRTDLLNPSSLPMALNTLRLYFGRPEIVFDAALHNLKQAPSVKMDRLETFIVLSTKVKAFCDIVRSSGMPEYLVNPVLLRELVGKLPAMFQMEWARHRRQLEIAKPYLTLDDFNLWLRDNAETSSTLITKHSAPSSSTNTKSAQRKNNIEHFHAVHENDTPEKEEQKSSEIKSPIATCKICKKKNHTINNCSKFIALSNSKRWYEVKKRHLCVGCLGKHWLRDCQKKIICGVDNCQEPHNSMLHTNKQNREGCQVSPSSSGQARKSSEASEAVTSSQATTPSSDHAVHIHEQQQQRAYYQIVPVTLYGASGRTVNTHAFLDGGSTVTIMEHELVDELELEGQPESLTLKWTSEITREEKGSLKVALAISSSQSDEKRYEIKDVRTARKLSLPVQSITWDHLQAFTHLRTLPIETYRCVRPRVLIGLDNHQLTVPQEVIEGLWDEPVGIRTRLGWTLFGGCKNSSQDLAINCHTLVTNEQLHDMVKNFFSLESIGIKIPVKDLDSVDNIRAEMILNKTVKQSNDGHYEAGLLWKSDVIELPQSKPMAMRRLLAFERKLNKNPALFQVVLEQINDHIRKGYLHKLTNEELESCTNRVWYLPMFTVTNPNKPAKTRIVWDAAAAVDGISLNSQLLVGPDLLQNLVSVLCNFRKNQFAITGDIKQMFHQVKIKREDQDVQRCLWRDNPKASPSTYRMTVMTFGASSSPYTAQFVKNANAEKYRSQYTRATDAIQNYHYVDDYIDSFATAEECLEVTQQVIKIHQSGGFELRNFMSNSPRVLSSLTNDALSVEKVFGNESDSAKILGMLWNISDDTLRFRIDVNRIGIDILNGKKCPTKRDVLRILMMIFDPLGLLGFFIIHGKIILKEIWRTGIQWDDCIKEEQRLKWNEWLFGLQVIESIKINRCYFPEQFEATYELHVFVDASEQAAAAVAYFVQSRGESRSISFISSRTKIAPNKTISIPRLELQAAVLGTRLSMSIKANHSFTIDRCIFWSDSRNVLCWIRSPRSFKPFVAHRVGEILDNTNSHDWRWVPTADNIADEASKWKMSSKHCLPERWYQGPKFLHENPSSWPVERSNSSQPTDEELEVRHHVMTIMTDDSSLTPDVERFSRLSRLVRTQAFVLRFYRREFHGSHVMTPGELDDALMYVIQSIQMKTFAVEWKALKKSQSLDKNSSLKKWSPFLDDRSIIRMQSRLSNVDFISYDQRFPIILPKKHHFTSLLISHFHEKYYHQNNETVLNELQQRYAIPSLRSQLKSIRRKCMKCRLRDARPQVPEMAVLPRSRTAASMRPFTFTGVDYFGPMQVKLGRRVEKRWGALFTCLTTRAVHVEVVSSLSADAFILVLRIFISRRGQPKQLFSDCGTNFKGAESELRRLLQDNLKAKVATHFASIEFHFNPPAAPHMGGAWERLVRSIKSGINHCLSERTPSEELLRSCLAEIESIVNSRPLTYVVADGEELEALTPNHFLLGSSSGVKPFGDFSDDVHILRGEWKRQQAMTKSFWIRFTNEYLPMISKRTRWYDKVPPLEIGDVVAVTQSSTPYTWQLGRIKTVVVGKDGNVRQADVATPSGILRRPASKLAVLLKESKEVKRSNDLSLGGGVTDGNI